MRRPGAKAAPVGAGLQRERGAPDRHRRPPAPPGAHHLAPALPTALLSRVTSAVATAGLPVPERTA